ncbi:MAG: hypothetical protein RAK23_05505, partial [Thermoplasmata archaeon]|nr:hypothetical protein [Thermoplasmata archaeon]
EGREKGKERRKEGRRRGNCWTRSIIRINFFHFLDFYGPYYIYRTIAHVLHTCGYDSNFIDHC